MRRTAVVLLNLGGPDSLAAVRPFLLNLFEDPAIIRLPRVPRWLVARFIVRRRLAVAREIYAHLGGASPILANTEAQARALEAALGPDFKVFVAMRYWHPLSDATAAAVQAWAPDRVLLLPLYPQYSTTTTASSIAAWHAAAERLGARWPTDAVCCYPREEGFVAAVVEPLRAALAETAPGVRVLFSAHGLPESIVASGDPYRWQVEETVAAVRAALARKDLDAVVCYQSRVGSLKWLQPETADEIRRAGAEKRALIVVPIAFVSEHSETLVELDRDYGRLAAEAGVSSYRRLPTVGTHPSFIAGLAGLVRRRMGMGLGSGCGVRLCPPEFRGCACAGGAG
jgi:ferrochelatase